MEQGKNTVPLFDSVIATTFPISWGSGISTLYNHPMGKPLKSNKGNFRIVPKERERFKKKLWGTVSILIVSDLQLLYQNMLLTTGMRLTELSGKLDLRGYTKSQNFRKPPTHTSFCNTGLILSLAITLLQRILHSQMTLL